jgi:glycosyltransferase involved in cell wall biosynthesis
MRACINSQTPFVRFNLTGDELVKKYGSLPDPVDLSRFKEGTDYEFSPGGVTAMVYPLVKKMVATGYLDKVVWVCLGVNYPKHVKVGDILVDHIEIPKETLQEYTAFKENLWSEIHGLPSGNITNQEFRGYARYNWANSEMLLSYRDDVDFFYVQDFQLLLTGGVIGAPAPAVLRWHVPFAPENLSPLTHRGIIKWIESFDAVVVSTRRDLEGLVKSAYRGRAHQVYPFVDPAEWSSRVPSKAEDSIRERVGLKRGEDLLLVVARMDRMKSQDLAIRAFARLKRGSKIRLALIGNGSFSSSGKGGLGASKGEAWSAELKELVARLGVQDSVSFLGHVSGDELRAAYSLSSLLLLPSRIEGFGLSVVEGWMNKKPAVVSKGAGVSELVIEGSNGYTFKPGDDEGAAEAIFQGLHDAEKLGENGFETAKQCYLDVAVEREKEILTEAISIYK